MRFFARDRSNATHRSCVHKRSRQTVFAPACRPFLNALFERNFRHQFVSLDPLKKPIFVAHSGLDVVWGL